MERIKHGLFYVADLAKRFFFLLKRNCVYRWWVLPVYALGYFICFNILEKHVTIASGFSVIEAPIDRLIPFHEAFIIPYNIWFVYIMGTVTFFVLFNKDRFEYYRFEIAMIIGMSIFLLISAFWANGQLLRPEVFPRDNFCTALVGKLYSGDTPTNIFPSMHVYNAVCAFLALRNCKMAMRKKWIVNSIGVLTILIIFSTMLLKQHSIHDVLFALVLNFCVHMLVYHPGIGAGAASE